MYGYVCMCVQIGPVLLGTMLVSVYAAIFVVFALGGDLVKV